MLGVPKSPDPNSPQRQQLLPTGVVVRLGFLAVFVASLFYLVVFWNPEVPIDPTELASYEEPAVAVPEVDAGVLAKARDATHEDRLFLESEPLRHLLEISLNVGPEKAEALGRPVDEVPVTELERAPGEWRGRWLHYKGIVETLSEPRSGHPVPGYSIYEATLRLPDGGMVLTTFSKPPADGVHVGGWARAEGFFLKLRDLTLPETAELVPMLVGRELLLDYEDWGPVEQLDSALLDQVIDTRAVGDAIAPTADAWRPVEEDQRPPLWHLAAYARSHDDLPLTEWRQIPALNATEIWEQFKRDEVPRGTPLRILGPLVSVRYVAAAPNPAGVQYWTEAWVQVRDLGGKTIPIWVPHKTELPIRSTLEVRGYYYRRLAYESRSGKQYWTPLFVAADLDVFELKTGPAMQEIGMVALTGTVILLLLAFWGARRESRRSREAEQRIQSRRRRRRLAEGSAS